MKQYIELVEGEEPYANVIVRIDKIVYFIQEKNVVFLEGNRTLIITYESMKELIELLRTT